MNASSRGQRRWRPPGLALIAAALAIGTPLGMSRAQQPGLVFMGPPGYGYLTLASGHTYKYLSSGLIIGDGGKRLGFGLAYVSDTPDEVKLEAAADELFRYVRPMADMHKEQSVVLVANLDFDPGQASSQSTTFNIVFTKNADGGWTKVPSKSRPPAVERRASHAEIIRDVAGERAARSDAEAWLALFDEEKYAAAWDAASPLLKGFGSRARWETQWSAARPELGRLLLRTPIATLSTRFVSGVPPGSYVVLEYLSSYENKRTAFESVTEMLCEDGRWRVAGYTIRG